MDKLDSDDSRPPYRQVFDALRSRIEDGTYEPGRALPSHKEVANEFGVSVGTAKRAFVQLQSERLIVTRQGQGSYVHTHRRAEEGEATSLAEVSEQLADVHRRLDAVETKLRDR